MWLQHQSGWFWGCWECRVQGTCRGTCEKCWIQSGRYFILFYFAEGDFILNFCLFSPVQREAQLDRGERLAEIQTPLPSTCSGAPAHHSCLQEHSLDLGAPLCLCTYRLSTFQGFICEGGRDDGHVGASGTRCYFSQSTFWGFSLKCVGNVRESKEWLLPFKRLLLVHFLFSSPGFERSREWGGRRDVELKLL